MSWFRRNLIVLRSGTPRGVLALTGIGQNLSLVLPAALFPFLEDLRVPRCDSPIRSLLRRPEKQAATQSRDLHYAQCRKP